MATVLQAAQTILAKAGTPLHYREITKRILADGLWQAKGKTPEATVNAQLSVAASKDDGSLFERTGPGTFALRDGATAPDVPPTQVNDAASATLSFTDAAETVLTKHAGKKPMHYKEITKLAIKAGMIKTAGQTPESTMYAQILQERQRREKRGERQRFAQIEKGMVSLTAWKPTGLADQIARHNDAIRKKLLQRIQNLTAAEFEQLVGRLLTAIGFNNVTVTRISKDGGIDVRGTLVVGDAVRMRMAVQAKKWKNNVQAPEVQKVRGSLGAHEQGLIITTSNFSAGAVEEASRPDASPVGLMSGQQLIGLLVEHGIGVTRQPHELLGLDESEPADADS